MSIPQIKTQLLSEIAAQMSEDFSILSSADDLSPALQDVIESPASAAMLRQLGRYGVTEIDVPNAEYSNPADRFQEYLMSGAQAMDVLGVPKPHLEDYYAAQSIASLTGHSINDIIKEFDAIRPLEVGVPKTSDALQSISIFKDNDTVLATENQEAGSIPGAAAQNYTE